MIKSVRLVNWKSHLDSVFEFSKGVNVLVGIMGSGKTSIVQAISFALFGTFPSHQSRKVNLDDLIMKRPQKKDRAEVHLEFIVSGKHYSVKRIIERGKGTTEAEIRENGKILNVNPHGVTEEVKRILRMDYELFSKAVYSEQNNLDYFLKIPKGKRMEHIDRMLNLERFEKAREQAVSLSNRALHSSKELSRIVLSMESENLEERRGSLKSEIEAMKKREEELRHSVERCSVSVSKLSASVSRLEEIESELNEIRRAMKGIESSITEINRTLESKKKRISGTEDEARQSLMKIEKEIFSLEEFLDKKREEEKKQREQIASMNTRMSLLSKEISALKKSIEEKSSLPDAKKEAERMLGEHPEKTIAGMELALNQKKQELYKILAQKENTEKNLAELKKADVNCPVCDSIIEESKKLWLIGEREREIKELDALVKKTSEEIEKQEKALMEAKALLEKLQSYEEAARTLEEEKKQLESKEGELESIREFISSLASNLSKITEEIKDRENRLGRLRDSKEEMKTTIEDIKLVSELEKRIEDKISEMHELSQREKQLAKTLSERDIKALRAELQEKVAEKRELENELKNISQRMEERINLLRETEKRISLLNEYRSEIKTNEALAGKLKTFASVLIETQNQLREEFLKTVNSIMDEIWREIYPYEDFHSARLAIDRDYVLQVKEPGGWVNVEGIVSGGERSIATLALRIAFSIAFMPNLKWLILDEPTHNLDDYAIERLTEILRENIHSFAEQVFLITHEERLAEASTGSMHKLERDKKSGGPTTISRE